MTARLMVISLLLLATVARADELTIVTRPVQVVVKQNPALSVSAEALTLGIVQPTVIPLPVAAVAPQLDVLTDPDPFHACEPLPGSATTLVPTDAVYALAGADWRQQLQPTSSPAVDMFPPEGYAAGWTFEVAFVPVPAAPIPVDAVMYVHDWLAPDGSVATTEAAYATYLLDEPFGAIPWTVAPESVSGNIGWRALTSPAETLAGSYVYYEVSTRYLLPLDEVTPEVPLGSDVTAVGSGLEVRLTSAQTLALSGLQGELRVKIYLPGGSLHREVPVKMKFLPSTTRIS